MLPNAWGRRLKGTIGEGAETRSFVHPHRSKSDDTLVAVAASKQSTEILLILSTSIPKAVSSLDDPTSN